MSQIEKIYCDWAENQPYSPELNEACDKVSDIIESLVGSSKIDISNEIYCVIMDCVNLGQIKAFKAGFQRATALWKEC